MRISFRPSEFFGAHGREHAHAADLAAVTRADLRWYYFLGALEISHHGTEIGPPWEWVPLFDALYCVQQVMIFAEGGEALGKIDFTENAESIDFELNGTSLHMVPSYLEFEATCTANEFISAGSDFIRNELIRVTSEHPLLAKNRHVRELAAGVSLELP
ncbi:hypothetical protein [Kitasatospora sp. NPDC005748]|uniref:hypothetical protein n=1 Tax=Kitasatospora sp. NPDC005748 TaxID=3157063 RepID=UPI0033C36993